MLFELQPRRDSAEQHQFLVLADPQTQTRAETGYFNDETVPDVQALLKSRAGIPTFRRRLRRHDVGRPVVVPTV